MMFPAIQHLHSSFYVPGPALASWPAPPPPCFWVGIDFMLELPHTWLLSSPLCAWHWDATVVYSQVMTNQDQEATLCAWHWDATVAYSQVMTNQDQEATRERASSNFSTAQRRWTELLATASHPKIGLPPFTPCPPRESKGGVQVVGRYWPGFKPQLLYLKMCGFSQISSPRPIWLIRKMKKMIHGQHVPVKIR